MQTKTIELGGQAFTLTELPLRKNAEWRKLFETKLEPLFSIVADFKKIEIDNADDLQRIISLLKDVVLKSPETLAELVFAYSLVLQEQREWIDANVYESELLSAVTEVLLLAYPFGSIVKLVTNLSGAAAKLGSPTLTNSVSPSGPQPANG